MLYKTTTFEAADLLRALVHRLWLRHRQTVWQRWCLLQPLTTTAWTSATQVHSFRKAEGHLNNNTDHRAQLARCSISERSCRTTTNKSIIQLSHRKEHKWEKIRRWLMTAQAQKTFKPYRQARRWWSRGLPEYEFPPWPCGRQLIESLHQSIPSWTPQQPALTAQSQSVLGRWQQFGQCQICWSSLNKQIVSALLRCD